MATDTSTKQYIKTQIAANLNIKDVTPQSKLSQMLDSYLNETDNYETYATNTLDNMFIQTCSEEFLDKAGAQEGISRLRLPTFRLAKSTGIVTIYNTGVTSTSILKRGKTIKLTDTIWVTLLEDLDLSNITSTPTAISVDLDLSSIASDDDSLSLKAGASFPIGLNSYHISINSDFSIPTIAESTEEFRARVSFSKYNSKFGSESAIRLAISSTSFVTDYFIDYSTSPFTIYLFSSNMLYTEDYYTYLETYAIPVVESQLLFRKADGANYTLKTPKQVGFSISLKQLKESPAEVPSALFTFIEHIERTYKPGTKVVYNTDSLIQFLTNNAIDTTFLSDYTVTFNRRYLNFTYASEDNSVTVFEDEYPFLKSITLE